MRYTFASGGGGGPVTEIFGVPAFFHAPSFDSIILRASDRLMSPVKAMAAWSGT